MMTWPMIVLAVGSVFAGGFFAIGGTLENWLEPVVGAPRRARTAPAWVVTVVTLAVVAVGIAIAYRMYATRAVPEMAPAEVSALTVAARRDLYGDAFNEEVFMRPGQLLTKGLVEIDDDGVDGVGQRAGRAGRPTSERMRGSCRPVSPAPTRCRCWPARPWWSRRSWR